MVERVSILVNTPGGNPLDRLSFLVGDLGYHHEEVVISSDNKNDTQEMYSHNFLQVYLIGEYYSFLK